MLRKKCVVYVDPACDILYSSYYIYGLKKLFGKVRFSGKYFSQFNHNNIFFPIVIKNGTTLYKIAIDFGDSFKIDEPAMEWCDVYGKININDGKVDLRNNPKVVSLGPGFGIQIFSKPQTLFLALINFLKSYKRISNKRRFFSDYYAQYNRQLFDYYQSIVPKDNYVFFVGAIWKKENETNRLRANYIKACKRVGDINFEGGFAPRSRNDVSGFDDITLKSAVPMADYLIKTKESVVVFNSPAVLDCHGWKLGEFMALGKAIISTHNKNRLPIPLEHGKNIHFVNGNEDDIYDAVKLLSADKEYRSKLENNIYNYYQEYVSPERSVQLLLEKAGLK